MTPSNLSALRTKLSPYVTAYIKEMVGQEVDAQVSSLFRTQKTDRDDVVALITKNEVKSAKLLASHATVMRKWLPAILGRTQAQASGLVSLAK